MASVVFAMQKLLIGLLVCPICKDRLVMKKGQHPELICRPDGLAFPIIDGVPIMLEGRARTLTVEERLSD